MSDDRNNWNSDEANAAANGEGSRCFGTSEEIVERYTHCHLCGSNLHFTHVTDFSRNLTHEQAKCLECGVKTQQITHRLQ